PPSPPPHHPFPPRRSSDLDARPRPALGEPAKRGGECRDRVQLSLIRALVGDERTEVRQRRPHAEEQLVERLRAAIARHVLHQLQDRKSTRLNSSHLVISYA